MYNIIFYSFGDNTIAKYIQKIGKAIDSGKITLKDVLSEVKNYKGNRDDIVEFVYNKLL